MQPYQAARLAHVERWREVVGRRKLVFAKAEAGELIANLLRHGKVGAEKVEELERVLLVRLPNLRAACFIGAVPGVAAADKTERNLAADGVVAIQFATWQRIKVESNPAHRP